MWLLCCISWIFRSKRLVHPLLSEENGKLCALSPWKLWLFSRCLYPWLWRPLASVNHCLVLEPQNSLVFSSLSNLNCRAFLKYQENDMSAFSLRSRGTRVPVVQSSLCETWEVSIPVRICIATAGITIRQAQRYCVVCQAGEAHASHQIHVEVLFNTF